jgi:predicted nucleotidyltransferase
LRLTADERQAIATAARATLLPGTRVSLFGSRTSDQARGGDIDLLVESAQLLSAAEWVRQRQAFVARLYLLLGERRIDVVASGLGEADSAASVLASARHRAVELVLT